MGPYTIISHMSYKNQLFTNKYKSYKLIPKVSLKTNFVALSNDLNIIAESSTYYGAYVKAFEQGISTPWIINENLFKTLKT